jgi:hypothetical protein
VKEFGVFVDAFKSPPRGLGDLEVFYYVYAYG